ncbi:hypothetical protein EC844_101414 [Acinetobacter calcoaceticus]|uniref:Uncharacterized protein n=1 Tax=Acinetobacter calcoaceticus TaxID=471 RepID=A0A4R1Y3G5_ACICA|nr:hypothetical protein EC844_101414 [Acinetobacter calcoaceticus]
MALNVGQDFKKRWLDAPEAVRVTLLDELTRISDLLNPETNIQQWLDHDQRAMQIAQLNIEKAYADLKAELIEAARVRKQLALEKSLASKRAAQQAYAEQLQQDEIQQFQQQTQSLHALGQNLVLETAEYSDRYQSNPILDAPPPATLLSTQPQMTDEVETIRLRLELEAEALIEETLDALRAKLKLAAQEEIQYLLAQKK